MVFKRDHRNPIDRCLPLTEVFFSNRQSEHPLVFMAPPRSWARSFQQMPPKAQPFQAVTVHAVNVRKLGTETGPAFTLAWSLGEGHPAPRNV